VLLRRILQNLITNAVKYTQKGGVVVGVRRDGDGLRIEVWDNGPGIPEDDQAAIFEEFRRGSSQDTGDVPGVGLGLAIVQRTADVLGHEVTLTSRPGTGTRFTVRLPRGERPAGGTGAGQAHMPGAGEAGRVDWSRRLVLLLENDPDIARGMQALFLRWNCPLLTAPTYEEMVERLEDEEAEPDFLIADLDLDTEVNGLMAVQRLREKYPGLMAALVTADRSAEVGVKADALGVERFFKPARPAELRAYIEHCWRAAEAE
jgi:anti-sigma regulatory factor (Ser/Thr protein kinase)/CheY-like chemotaxis protein